MAIAAPKNRIAFSSKKYGSEDMFIMDEDGENVELLIQIEGNEFLMMREEDILGVLGK